MLVKKMLSYHKILKPDQKTIATPINSSRRSNRSHYSSNPILSPCRKQILHEVHTVKNEEFYKDVKNKKRKLSELKQLMKAEIIQIQKSDNKMCKFQSLQPIEGQKHDLKYDLKINFYTEEQLLKILEDKANDDSDFDINSDVFSNPLNDDKNQNQKRVFDRELFHLNTNKHMVFGAGDEKKYDFHERKSKEIRRLQYVAGIRFDT